eukprot:scaffold2506_cov236-Pinguiococcus_pyrenoidosus.AAC.15
MIWRLLFLLLCSTCSPKAKALSRVLADVARVVSNNAQSCSRAVKCDSKSSQPSPRLSRSLLASEGAHDVLRRALSHRGHLVLSLDEDDASMLTQSRATLENRLFGAAGEAERLLGVARPLSAQRDREFVGVFEGEESTFVEVRFDRDGKALPDGVDGVEMDELRLILGNLARQVIDVALQDAEMMGLVDDMTCLRFAPHEEDLVSSTVQRLSFYDASAKDNRELGTHTDTSFVTVIPFTETPGIEVYDPSLDAWMRPEAQPGSRADRDVLVLPGELLDLASCGRYCAAPHRIVVAKGMKRMSTPLLVRARRSALFRSEVPMASVWASLQKSSPEEAKSSLSADLGKQKQQQLQQAQLSNVAGGTFPTPPQFVIPVRRGSRELVRFYKQFCTDAQILSASPPVVYMKGFASDAECAAILREAARRFQGWSESSVISDDGNARHVVERETRTSSTMWIKSSEDAACQRVLDKLAKKAAEAAELPVGNSENWQLARYQVGQQFRLHTDTVEDFNDLLPGGRITTLILYLNEDFVGGHTDFPKLGLSVEPERGAALLFTNAVLPVQEPFGMITESRAAHCGNEVLEGEKFIVSRWFHPVSYPHGLQTSNESPVEQEAAA